MSAIFLIYICKTDNTDQIIDTMRTKKGISNSRYIK
ncbi:hypothetical protein DFP82_102230 [Psychrobacter fozii]|uniref:Uncharacterized protein n=1 Tax=Psychrobacter fozii TaxID=198480 RepID=A0A2V4VDD3_9GAMM|nr:hypothetical protein DFP82_102230 [Psychrobacter fozii]